MLCSRRDHGSACNNPSSLNTFPSIIPNPTQHIEIRKFQATASHLWPNHGSVSLFLSHMEDRIVIIPSSGLLKCWAFPDAFQKPPIGVNLITFMWEIHQQKVSGSPSSYLLLLLLAGKVPTPRNNAICFACMHVHHLLHHPSTQNQL